MPTTLHSAVTSYLRSARLSRGTKAEYQTNLRKWAEWGRDLPLEELGRKEIREFLEWVHERAVTDDGTNPGRTANKAREQLRAVVAWAWDQELIDALPRFPKRRAQRDVAGRHCLTKAEINAIYFATYPAHRAPLAFRAIMTLRQPTAFTGLVRGHDGECPCCRRRFAEQP